LIGLVHRMKLQEWAILIQPSPGATVFSHTLINLIINIDIFGLTQVKEHQAEKNVTLFFVKINMIMLKSLGRSQFLGIRRHTCSNRKTPQNCTEAFGFCSVDENPCFHFFDSEIKTILMILTAKLRMTFAALNFPRFKFPFTPSNIVSTRVAPLEDWAPPNCTRRLFVEVCLSGCESFYFFFVVDSWSVTNRAADEAWSSRNSYPAHTVTCNFQS